MSTSTISDQHYTFWRADKLELHSTFNACCGWVYMHWLFGHKWRIPNKMQLFYCMSIILLSSSQNWTLNAKSIEYSCCKYSIFFFFNHFFCQFQYRKKSLKSFSHAQCESECEVHFWISFENIYHNNAFWFASFMAVYCLPDAITRIWNMSILSQF